MYPQDNRAYTWWSPFRKSNREGNKGWRIDYFLASWKTPASGPKILQCEHLTSVMGSDHCPIKLKIKQKKKAKATNKIISSAINEAIVQCHGDTYIQLVCDTDGTESD